MRTKEMAAWYRHFDFILIDLFCMQAALAIAYSFRNGWSMIFEESYYSRMAVTLMILQLIVVFFCESYEGKINFTDGEVKELQWFDLDELPENLFKVNKPIINDVKEFVSNKKVIVK